METFKKRQKEMRRLEKQRDKFAKRMEKKLHRGEAADSPTEEPAEMPEAPLGETPAAEPQTAQ